MFSSRWSTFHLLSILFVKLELIRHDGDFENNSALLFDDIFLLFTIENDLNFALRHRLSSRDDEAASNSSLQRGVRDPCLKQRFYFVKTNGLPGLLAAPHCCGLMQEVFV